ncbi:hypothetical protein Ciccas_009065 [Cichlidogyrus casuarinus]|uniref:Uncharacterized protein n=1 Tax=Cichlidogyrus casuarinus TaxID=1844966 RepID=A0ABD2PZS6_9PLAT
MVDCIIMSLLKRKSDKIFSYEEDENESQSKTVIFEEDVRDNEVKQDSKLMRRDTPHFKKASRIQKKTPDGSES